MGPATAHPSLRRTRARGAIVCLVLFGCSRLAGVDYDTARGREGDASDERAPTDVPPPKLPKLVAGGYQTAFLTGDGVASWWGSFNWGARPFTTLPAASRPIQPFRELSEITDIAASDMHACVLAEGGRAFCIGRPEKGERGVGWPGASKVPVAIDGVIGARRIFGGSAGGCASNIGRLTCWGAEAIAASSPIDIPDIEAPEDVAISDQHACALERGTVKCWGDNGRGQLGRGSRAGGHHPEKVVLPGPASAITANRYSSCAIVSGNVYCWGARFYPGSSLSTDTDNLLPVRVSLAEPVVSMAIAGHACVVTTSGSVWCWGADLWGATGHPPDNDKQGFETPARVEGAPADAISVAVGFAHTCAVTQRGRVSCWGMVEFGMLGHDTPESKLRGWDAPGYVEGL